MLAETAIELEACNPAANCLRRWRVEFGQDLLGIWVVEVEFGRIGSRGCRVQHVFPDEPAARVFVGHTLRRRATAPKRIGVACRWVRASIEAREWLDRVGIAASATASLSQALGVVLVKRGLRREISPHCHHAPSRRAELGAS
jgi:hypothetical protein